MASSGVEGPALDSASPIACTLQGMSVPASADAGRRPRGGRGAGDRHPDRDGVEGAATRRGDGRGAGLLLRRGRGLDRARADGHARPAGAAAGVADERAGRGAAGRPVDGHPRRPPPGPRRPGRPGQRGRRRPRRDGLGDRRRAPAPRRDRPPPTPLDGQDAGRVRRRRAPPAGRPAGRLVAALDHLAADLPDR